MKVNKRIDQNIAPTENTSHLRVVENQSHNLSVKARKRRSSNNPLRKVRVEKGLTLDDLSEKSGLSPSYLSRLEGGSRRLNIDILEILCKTLDCKEDVLFSMTQPTEKNSYTKQSNGKSRKASSAEKKIQSYTLSPLGNSQGYFFNIKTTKLVNRPKELDQCFQAFALNVEQINELSPLGTKHLVYVDPTSNFDMGSLVFAQLSEQQRCYIGTLKKSDMDGMQHHFTLELLNKEEVVLERGKLTSLFKALPL